MTAIKSNPPVPRSPRRPPVAFHVTGEELFLDGLFRRWQSNLSTGPDLDEATVQLIVDATSPEDLLNVAEDNVVAFESRDVKKTGRSVYRARGTLHGHGGDQEVEALFEVPRGHNAYFAVTFAANKTTLGDAWHLLVPGEVQEPADLEAERRLDPRMGVRLPEVAQA